MQQPRLAATAIVARPAPDGLQVYLTRRNARSAFAPDAFVFPGGAVDPADFDPHVQARIYGIGAQRANAAFRAEQSPELPSSEPAIDTASAQALFVTALRELFEETGMLLMRTSNGDSLDESVAAEDTERATVRDDARAFAGVLDLRGALADATRLTLFSHWITPPSESRRFNTHFFVAIVEGDRSGSADASETHDGVWLSPPYALQRYEAGTLHLVYPTIKHLERLRGFESVDELQRFARSKPIVTILPSGEPGRFQLPPALENAW
jgi:8-oxo-dGTP pyrophosphatase MutT (NUDIX family)